MHNNDLPKGQRFSLLYLRNDDVLRDCPRMRRRVAMTISDYLSDYERVAAAGHYLEAELGISVTITPAVKYVSWNDFLGECNLADFLDTVTLVYRVVIKQRWEGPFRNYRDSIQRIFRECNVGYRLDEQCGVHPYVDTAFEISRANAMAGLADEHHNATRKHLDLMEQALMGDPPNNLQAIRSTFDAAENIVKMMFTGVTQLNKSAIQNNLRPKIDAMYADQQATKNTILKLCDGFRNWVEAAHFYRHADGQPELTQPPDELTVLMVSQGYGWVRWLAELEKAVPANNN